MRLFTASYVKETLFPSASTVPVIRLISSYVFVVVWLFASVVVSTLPFASYAIFVTPTPATPPMLAYALTEGASTSIKRKASSYFFVVT